MWPLEPQRVLRQLGFTQRPVIIAGELHILSHLIVEAIFVGQRKERILIVIERFFWPAWVMSLGGALYWQKCIGVMDEFATTQDKYISKIDVLLSIKTKDPF